MKDKEFVIREIRRVAKLKGGESLGMRTFARESGIAEHEWRGVYWARWTDAVLEAGVKPGDRAAAFTAEQVLVELARLVRKFGRYPTTAEILIEGKNNDAIPGPKPIAKRLGNRTEILRQLCLYCTSHEELTDVFEILTRDGTEALHTNTGSVRSAHSEYVYLVKSGKMYKIGRSENHWRRKSELHKQTSEGITEIHTIVAIDDAPGIEKYWHERFAEKRRHGEWFELSSEDIKAFKKRKLM
jgi:hypothetical protein